MVHSYLHWCPNGCGKSVIYIKKAWCCTRCKVIFGKKKPESLSEIGIKSNPHSGQNDNL